MNKHFSPLLIIVLALAIIVVVIPPTSAAASGHTGTTFYVVKQGDRLASIARHHCTTWQEIYRLNRYTIGHNPHRIYPGMILHVPDHCHGSGGDPGYGCYDVWDRGPSQHAQGQVMGNRYYVVKGDTWYSVGKRFGVSVEALRHANHMYILYGDTIITIPCLGTVVPPPQPPPSTSAIAITSPPPGSVLPATFQVTGTGVGLFEANVVVRALAQGGAVLAEKATTLQGPNVGTGGAGTWSVQLTVNTAPGTTGSIRAFNPESGVFAIIPVTYGQGGGGNVAVDYPPGTCTITVKPNAPAYNAPNGTEIGRYSVSVNLSANRREPVSGINWYRVQEIVNGNPQQLWISQNDLSSVGAGCY